MHKVKGARFGTAGCASAIPRGRALRAARSRVGQLNAMDPAKTAILLIEYQNDFTAEGGKLHDGVKGVMESTGMLSNTSSLVEKAREKGCTIVHAPIVFSDDYKELGDDVYGILAGVKEGGCFKASE